MTYKVIAREEGSNRKKTVHAFKTLAEVQQYCKDRWEGPDYIDGLISFHNDYCTFNLMNCTLADLGARRGPAGTQEYWDWEWKHLKFRTSDGYTLTWVPDHPGWTGGCWTDGDLCFGTDNSGWPADTERNRLEGDYIE